MKLLHTSDWHIGRDFNRISLIEEQRKVLGQIRSYVEIYSVDVLIVAGDIFDKAIPPVEAIEVVSDFFYELTSKLGVVVIAISGNHDSAKRIGFGAEHMRRANLHILSDISRAAEPITISKDQETVQFFGMPYHFYKQVAEIFPNEDIENATVAHRHLCNLAKDRFKDGVPNVLISHCFATGGEQSESERPLIEVGGADQIAVEPMKDFDYVALGHLHRPQQRGENYVRYSGSLMKYSFSEEAHEKEVVLVELNSEGLRSMESLPLKQDKDVREIRGNLKDLLAQGRSDTRREDFLKVVLTDREYLLEPMSKLREVYPNILHLEKLPTDNSDVGTELGGKANTRDPVRVFKEFYGHVVGEKMTKRQSEILKDVLSEMEEEERAS